MRKLFLDDTRNAPDFTWDVVRSYEQFVAHVQLHGVPDVISFDHDLGFEHYPFNEESPGKEIPYDTYKEKTGYHCAKWLIENHKLPAQYIVHSLNPVGAANIHFVMQAGYKHEKTQETTTSKVG
jgi:hypothetical protein